MKICDGCSMMNLDDVEECPSCGCREFSSLSLIQETDDIEPYLRKNDDN